MPRVDELPLPAQAEIRAQRGQAQGEDRPDKGRMSLLQRLASVGLGRRDEPAGRAQPPRQAAPARPAAPPAPPAPQPAADYARRPPQPRQVQQSLDQHGRVAPSPIDDDQLEIPAFLRRQAR
jgi:cell division protein FtsZ